MPTHDFSNIGDVLNFELLRGTIVTLDSATDTCTVNVGGGVLTALLFYHCATSSVARENGAIEGAAAGFTAGDSVIVLKRHDNTSIKVIGHTDGIRRCESGADYYFIHNFETAVDQSDYVWDMEYPAGYELYYEDTVLDADAKFGNYACNITNAYVGMYYKPYTPTEEFWPPLTYEYWFKASETNGYLYGEIWIYGRKYLPEGGWNYSMYQTWFDVAPYTGEWWPAHSYMEDWIFDCYDNKISDLQYAIPFPLGEYVHCAIVVLPDRIRVFYNGVLSKEYISPQADGFNVAYSDFYIYNYGEEGGKLLVDALSITKGEKYTTNFTPPTEPPSA